MNFLGSLLVSAQYPSVRPWGLAGWHNRRGLWQIMPFCADIYSNRPIDVDRVKPNWVRLRFLLRLTAEQSLYLGGQLLLPHAGEQVA